MSQGLIILHDASRQQWLRFESPCEIICADRTQDVVPALRNVETLTRDRGWYAAGFIGYEAGSAFDAALKTHAIHDLPLLWFGLYAGAEVTDLPSPDYHAYTLGDPEPSISREEYDRAIECVKRYIRSGDTYQVNFTMRLQAPFRGDAWHLFLAMVRAQSPGYAGYVDTGRYAICSASPELFFRLEHDDLTCKPMKGTVHRGRTLGEDRELSRWLQNSEKNRAENLMIVDMIRNDLGRVADVGSVRVPAMFDVERHPTLWQMTSTITARCGASLSDIMAALFPCASITGAPKVRTSEIIAELEPDPRRIYTGCIGFLAPDRRAQFSVAIRTALVDRRSDRVEYGSGGGIVWDSASRDEYTEALLKARVLTERRPEFALLETMRWTPEESYYLLDYHLRRLADSAEYFDYKADLESIRAELHRRAAAFGSDCRRVRLLLERGGRVEIRAEALPPAGSKRLLRVALAESAVQSSDIFLYHKTTYRRAYEEAQRRRPDYDDVLLWNESGELTESCIANLVVEIDGERYTPPVDCGLLPGTFRAWLLDQCRVRERRLKVDDLKRCGRVWLVNSVRKWQEAEIIIPDSQFPIPDKK